MKLSLLFVLAIFASFCLDASSGKAYVPFWKSSDSGHSIYHLSISNISEQPVDVVVTLFNFRGAKLLSSVYRAGFSDEVGIAQIGLNDFKLAANQTQVIHLSGLETYGYGLIEWEIEGTQSEVLLANSWIQGVSGISSLSINNGNPF